MSEKSIRSTEVKTESYICPGCGGKLGFDGKKDKFLCTSCGYEGEIHAGDNSVDEYDFSDYARREAESVAFSGMAAANCQNCGAQVTFAEHEIATTCPMCGSTQISQVKQKAGIPPEGIIPFRIGKQEAGQYFREWVRGLWFAPSKLKKSYQEGQLTGMYVPFWTFDADGIGTYTGEGGRYRKVKDKDGKEQTETDWFPVLGKVEKSFDDILVVAATGDGAKDVELVGPYNTKDELKPYAPEYMAGYRAELYSIKADEGYKTAKKKMKEELQSRAESEILKKFDTSRNVNVSARYTNVTYKHVLLPVWSSLFGYGGKTYRYVVNGANGTVYGQRPYSKGKIAAAIAVALAILIAIFGLFAGEDESGQEMAAVSVQPTVLVCTELSDEPSYGMLADTMDLI